MQAPRETAMGLIVFDIQVMGDLRLVVVNPGFSFNELFT